MAKLFTGQHTSFQISLENMSTDNSSKNSSASSGKRKLNENSSHLPEKIPNINIFGQSDHHHQARNFWSNSPSSQLTQQLNECSIWETQKSIWDNFEFNCKFENAIGKRHVLTERSDYDENDPEGGRRNSENYMEMSSTTCNNYDVSASTPIPMNQLDQSSEYKLAMIKLAFENSNSKIEQDRKQTTKSDSVCDYVKRRSFLNDMPVVSDQMEVAMEYEIGDDDVFL